ncbi:MAG: hypothetical protein OEV93_02720 [Candidatus Moranbacteria bacterium]|nr:hypothetical protein [Candidatus Moranbacteria bacterium]
MTLKSYMWGMRIETIISLAVWLTVVNRIDPQEAGFVGQAFFYLSLWMFLSGALILFLTWMRRIFTDTEIAFTYLGMSFRQGVLLALIVVILLILQSFRVLVWWDGLLVITGVLLIELYFLSR